MVQRFMADSAWAEDLAAAMTKGLLPWGVRAEILSLQVLGPDSCEITFRYGEGQRHRAVRVTRGQLAGAEVVRPDRTAAELAFLVCMLAIDEPHADGDFEEGADGLLWLRPSSWIV